MWIEEQETASALTVRGDVLTEQPLQEFALARAARPHDMEVSSALRARELKL
ncbi:MAG: hypothetical protein SGJ26_09515 [Nitrospirota bacterium]|nr:hypothetical protein [Nitrospirota bacterium]